MHAGIRRSLDLIQFEIFSLMTALKQNRMNFIRSNVMTGIQAIQNSIIAIVVIKCMLFS